MTRVEGHGNDTDGRIRRPRPVQPEPVSRKVRGVRTPQTSVAIEAPRTADIDESNRKEVLSLASKEIASSLGSRVLLAMLAESGKSMRQVARDSGFDVSVLSNIANGRRMSGPELWTLVALAEAMGLDLQLTFSRR